MNFKSHTRTQIVEALERHIPVYELDTANYGEDDVLTGSFQECLSDVLAYFDLEYLPVDWNLRRVDYNEIS
jgi:hypothetical protein